MTERYKKQDEMFVQWSKNITEKTYDVSFLIKKLKAKGKTDLRVLDIGGAVGTVAKAVTENFPSAIVDIVDLSPLAYDNFIKPERTNFIMENFLKHKFQNKYNAIVMRVLLHHLVERNEEKTFRSQSYALHKSKELLHSGGAIFVTENFYQPFCFHDVTGRLVYEMTKLKNAANIFRLMGANSAGEGVRFRSWESWESLFNTNGLEIVGTKKSPTWGQSIPWWQKIPLFCLERFQAIVMLQVIKTS